ncbi:MAG TPA: hypothetical protein VGL86_13270 [Polyangia bacterium]
MSRVLAVAFALVAAAGCTKARTEAVVLVTTDGLRVPDDVDAIELSVADSVDEADPVFDHQFYVCGGAVSDCMNLPLEFTLIPGAHRDHSSRVEVIATRNGTPVIDDATLFTFAEGQSLRLDFVLYGNCIDNLDCAARDQACGPDAMCQPVPAVPITRDPDLSAAEPDLGAADLGAEDLAAPADLAAPSDLSTPPDFAGCVPQCTIGLCGDNGCGHPCLCGSGQMCVNATCVFPDMAMSSSDMAMPSSDMAMSTPDMAMPSTDMSASASQVLTWTASTAYDTGTFYAVWGLGTTVYAVGDPGADSQPVWKHNIAGTALDFGKDTGNPVTGRTLRSIWGVTKTEAYAVGDSGAIISLGTSGNWTAVIGSGLTAQLNGVWIGGPDSPTVWAVGGTISGQCMDTSQYDNFGTSWNGAYSSTSTCAYGGVWSDGSGNAVLVANEGLITYSSDDGATMNDFDLTGGNTNYLHGVWGPSIHSTIIVGDNGSIYDWGLNGLAIITGTETSNTTVSLRAVHGTSASDVWAVGGNTVLHRASNGVWTAQTNLPTNSYSLYGVYALGTNDVYVVGTVLGEKLILHGQ